MREMIDALLQAEVMRMVVALKAIEPPADHVGIERMAKALVAVKKASDLINAVPDSNTEDNQRELDAMHDDDLPPTHGPDALDAWAELLERKIARYRETGSAERVDQAAQSGRMPGDPSGLEHMGQSGTNCP